MKSLMVFEENKSMKKLGERLGFLAAYFVFTTVLYLILILTHRLPAPWDYLHIMGITAIITLIGVAIRRILR